MIKSNILDVEVSFFENFNAKPKSANLFELLTDSKHRQKIEAVRVEKDKERVRILKGKLPSFTPSGIFEERKASGLIRHSGLICIDIDEKDNTHLENFGDLPRLIQELPFVAYCGLSVGGKGYFVLMPILNPKKHKEHFLSLENAFLRCGIKVDTQCKDISRLRFVSYDSDPYINPNAVPFPWYAATKKLRRAESAATSIKSNVTKQKQFAELQKYAAVCRSEKIDLTGDYGTWFNSFALPLAHEYGEQGRGLFHTFSEPYVGYDYEDADKKYNEALKAVRVPNIKHPRAETVFSVINNSTLSAVSDFL